jgi:hypothetical protein
MTREPGQDELVVTLKRRKRLPTGRPYIKWVGPPPPGGLTARLESVLALTTGTPFPVLWAGARCLPEGTHELYLNIQSAELARTLYLDRTTGETEWFDRVSGYPTVVRARDDRELLSILEVKYAPFPLRSIS